MQPSAEPDRRYFLLGAFRSVATATGLVVLYYILPLDRLASVPLAVILGVALLLLIVFAAWQLRLVLRARYPGVRAVEALATSIPLFLLLFSSAYFVLARANPASFTTASLTRTDSLYFTVVTFTTVGYGDLTAVTQTARVVVIAQMVLDLLVLGLGVRVFVGVVQFRRQAQQDIAGADPRPQRPDLE